MYYTYVLLSNRDNKFYIGYSADLRVRFNEHQEGKVTATQNRRPLMIVYYEACLNKQDAIKREKYFKTGFGRRFLSNRLKIYLTEARMAGGAKPPTGKRNLKRPDAVNTRLAPA